MNRIFTFLALASFLLSGCSTIKNKATQNITVLAPGTGGTLCVMERPGFRERIWTPKTIVITKSKDTINFSCVAPGNREERFDVKPTINRSYYYNIATLGLGAIYDAQTGAMYEYPQKIIIDFSTVKPTTQPLPEYQQLLAEYPDLAGVEEFRPGKSMLMRDDDAPQRLVPADDNPDNGSVFYAHPTDHSSSSENQGANTSQPPLALVPAIEP